MCTAFQTYGDPFQSVENKDLLKLRRFHTNREAICSKASAFCEDYHLWFPRLVVIFDPHPWAMLPKKKSPGSSPTSPSSEGIREEPSAPAADPSSPPKAAGVKSSSTPVPVVTASPKGKGSPAKTPSSPAKPAAAAKLTDEFPGKDLFSSKEDLDRFIHEHVLKLDLLNAPKFSHFLKHNQDEVISLLNKDRLPDAEIVLKSKPDRIYGVVLESHVFLVDKVECYLIKVGMSTKAAGTRSEHVKDEIEQCNIGNTDCSGVMLFDLPISAIDSRETTDLENRIRWKCGWPITHSLARKADAPKFPFYGLLPNPTEWALVPKAKLDDLKKQLDKAQSTQKFTHAADKVKMIRKDAFGTTLNKVILSFKGKDGTVVTWETTLDKYPEVSN